MSGHTVHEVGVTGAAPAGHQHGIAVPVTVVGGLAQLLLTTTQADLPPRQLTHQLKRVLVPYPLPVSDN